MAGTQVSIDLRGLGKFRSLIQRMAKEGGNKSVLHQRYGIETLKWVDKNFASRGQLAGGWKPLSPNTIAGRRKGSSVPLQDTRGLRRSFTMKFNAEDARVGSPMAIAEYHEKGTGPYTIKPKDPNGVLAFRAAFASNKVKASFSSTRTKKTFRKGEAYAFAREVKHPGLPKRAMLPTAAQILPTLIRVTQNFLNELKRRGETL